jgi:hypothetical protein
VAEVGKSGGKEADSGCSSGRQLPGLSGEALWRHIHRGNFDSVCVDILRLVVRRHFRDVLDVLIAVGDARRKLDVAQHFRIYRLL